MYVKKTGHQIIINAMPRSGTTWLMFVLSEKISPGVRMNNSDTPSEEFVIKTHTPVSLWAKYNNFTQVNIVRDPIDVISSLITKNFGGIGSTVTNGVAIPSENPDMNIDSHIESEIRTYTGYAEGALQNLDRLKIFTFDQVTKDLEHVSRTLLGDDMVIGNNEIPYLESLAARRIKVHKLAHPGFNNGMPCEKPAIYNDIKNRLLEHDTSRVRDLYAQLKEIAKG
jgi:hypothetical protein